MAAGPAFAYATDRLVAPMTGVAGNPAVERFGAPPVKVEPGYSTPLLAGTYTAQGKRETVQPSYYEDQDIIAPPPDVSPRPEIGAMPSAPQPSSGDEDVITPLAYGGRTAYRKGGRIATGIEPLVQNLMTGYKKARAAEVATTKPLLHHSDQTIVRALRVAKKAI
jgi:hypothetical protein